jgi:hypothetical protein
MSIAHNIIMICIDIQGEDQHHCRKEQELGYLGNPSVDQKPTEITSQLTSNRNARSNQFERYSYYGRSD